jgi:hypothetical protein
MEGNDDDQLPMWEHWLEATAEEDAGEAEIIVPHGEDVLLPAHGEADPGQAAMVLKYQEASSWKQAIALEHDSRLQVAQKKPESEAQLLMKKLQREVSKNKPKSEAQLLMKKLQNERYKEKRKEKMKLKAALPLETAIDAYFPAPHDVQVAAPPALPLETAIDAYFPAPHDVQVAAPQVAAADEVDPSGPYLPAAHKEPF